MDTKMVAVWAENEEMPNSPCPATFCSGDDVPVLGGVMPQTQKWINRSKEEREEDEKTIRETFGERLGLKDYRCVQGIGFFKISDSDLFLRNRMFARLFFNSSHEFTYEKPTAKDAMIITAQIFPVAIQDCTERIEETDKKSVNFLAQFRHKTEALMVIQNIISDKVLSWKYKQNIVNASEKVYGEKTTSYHEQRFFDLSEWPTFNYDGRIAPPNCGGFGLKLALNIYNPTQQRIDRAATSFRMLIDIIDGNFTELNQIISLLNQANRTCSTLEGVGKKWSDRMRLVTDDMYKEANKMVAEFKQKRVPGVVLNLGKVASGKSE